MTTSAEPAGGTRAGPRRVPDFFVVGHPKSGTTALYEMLRAHPQIYMPDIKELRFFATDLSSDAGQAEASQTLDDHLSVFDRAPADACVGEMSVACLWSRTAAAAIAEAQPAARIIAILREPASFLRSLHLQRLRHRSETEKSLRTAMSLEQARREGRHIPPGNVLAQSLQYSERVQYVEQLRRYHAHFPPEQVLVLIYDDFRSDNVATMRKVLRFLDVDDTHSIEPVEANPTVALRSGRIEDLSRRLSAGRGPLSRALRDTGRALTTQRMRASLHHPALRRIRFGQAPPPEEDFMLELRERFKPEVQALSDYLGRDLVSLWGYDQIG